MAAATATSEVTSRKKAESPSTASDSRANGKRLGSGTVSVLPGVPSRTPSETPSPATAPASAAT